MHETRIGPGAHPVKEISLTDNSIGVRLYYQEPTRDGIKSVRIVQKQPKNIDRFRSKIELIDFLNPDKEFESEERQLIDTAGHAGEIGSFARIEDFHDLVAGLGYRYYEETEDTGLSTVKTINFEYPTIDRLNEFSSEAFPDEDSVQFVEHPGGHYSAVEFISSLVNDGQILIASEQPYQLHDHAALHVLGWIGLGGEYLKHIRPVYRSFLDRMEAEEALPPIPRINDRRVSAFMRPSLEVIKGGMGSLDNLSFEVGQAVFMDGNDENWSIHEKIHRRIESSFSLRQGDSAIPSNILVQPSIREKDRLAADVLRRFARAEHFAKSKVAA
jgi:hypothetical protein